MADVSKVYRENWRKIHEEHGLETVRARIAAASDPGRSVGEAYLKELKEKQEDIRNIACDKREADLVKYTKIAAVSAALAVVVSLWALGKSYGG